MAQLAEVVDGPEADVSTRVFLLSGRIWPLSARAHLLSQHQSLWCSSPIIQRQHFLLTTLQRISAKLRKQKASAVSRIHTNIRMCTSYVEIFQTCDSPSWVINSTFYQSINQSPSKPGKLLPWRRCSVVTSMRHIYYNSVRKWQSQLEGVHAVQYRIHTLYFLIFSSLKISKNAITTTSHSATTKEWEVYTLNRFYTYIGIWVQRDDCFNTRPVPVLMLFTG